MWNGFPTIGVSDDQLWLGSRGKSWRVVKALTYSASGTHREPGHRLVGQARWDSLKMAFGEVICVGAPLAAPLFRAVRAPDPTRPVSFLSRISGFERVSDACPPCTESSSVLDITFGRCYRPGSTVVFILHFLPDAPYFR